MLAIGLDTSGSMSCAVMGNRGRGAISKMRCIDVAALFATPTGPSSVTGWPRWCARMVRVARKVHDWRLLKLIGRYLRTGVMVDTELQPSIEGTMQGGPLSPILANILLDEFDKELEHRGLHFVRSADDFLVFTKSGEAVVRVARSIENYLTRKLKLVINHQKSRVCRTAGVEFLGFAFEGWGGQIRVSTKNERKFRDRVKEITRRNRGVSMRHRFMELRRYIQGWVGYFRRRAEPVR